MEMLLSCPAVTLKTALSAPRPSPDYKDMNFYISLITSIDSIAILHTCSDWFHGASDFNHYSRHEHYLEYQ